MRNDGQPSVAFATFQGEPEGAADDRIAAEMLARRGVHVAFPRWDDPGVDWAQFEIVLPRSTWDYHRRLPEFFRWAERVDRSTTLVNPLATIRRNAHKGYLVEMEASGAPVVPTEIVRARAPESLERISRRRGWAEVLIKPAIGADSDGLWWGDSGTGPEGERQLERLLTESDALVQPFLPRVRELGERSLVYFAGQFSHACAYRAVIDERPRQVRPYSPTPAELDVAQAIVERYAPSTLYARLDFLPGEDGRWLLGELELIEPELLFRGTEEGAGRFAEGLLTRIRQAPVPAAPAQGSEGAAR